MTQWILAVLLAVLGAWLAYGPLRRGSTAPRGTLAEELSRSAASGKHAPWLLGALRAGAYLCLLAMLFGAPAGRSKPLPPLPLLDVSESWTRAGDGSLWRAALDSLAAQGSDSVLLAGDSARLVSRSEMSGLEPGDLSSKLQPALDVATAMGRSVVLITDGEVDDPTAMLQLPSGSRVIRPERETASDLAVSQLEMPAYATGGDTIDVHVTIVAGNDSVRDAELRVKLGESELDRVNVQPLESAASRRISFRLPLPRGAGPRVLTAIVSAASDAEPRNDSLSAMLDIADRPRVVFVSTVPDLDVREALRVLRGAVMLPARAYLRVAPGVWREEGTLAPISESEVQTRAREAGLLVLHGDTAWSGIAAQRRGATITWIPAPPPPVPRPGEVMRATEWFVFRAPPSPISAVLSALPFDSLPPIELGPETLSGVTLLEARVGRTGAARAVASVSASGGPRRLRIIGSGYASWALRDGRSSDAFTALWGAIFDWMAASEGSGDGVWLGGTVLRAGEALRWHRGGTDSAAVVVVTPAGGAPDSIQLRFDSGADVVESAPLPAGRYTVQSGSITRDVILNPSRELVPRIPARVPPDQGAGALSAVTRPLLERTWPIVVALVLLSVEWLLRRRVGLR